ncbi:MBL fold metallo-hydrolase [Histomonas meleagridis]|uniref:MBL fold metallo-hydrolase n=1 Tax=Histomonas meleagridis TaxID=135588 RepID=UPI003559903A|nr:MBL fold metallo-hydrolase [Histomonas meleagridis]KAH0801603.1 MBL fold metallo-hydrolase [Histomonas meleagridis]
MNSRKPLKSMGENKITFSIEILGSGTSHGVPSPGCRNPTCCCHSTDPRDKRTRQSAFLRFSNGINILIDCGTDMRTQLTRANVKSIDYLFITHKHADHIHGFSDLRLLARQKEIPVYLEKETLDAMLNTYHYLFHGQTTTSKNEKFALHLLEKVTHIGPISVVKVPIFHGDFPICGFRIGKMAYLTDCSQIPEESYPLLKGIDYLFIDSLSLIPFNTHFCFNQALDEIEKIKPKHAWFIHVAHNLSYVQIDEFVESQRKERPGLEGIEVHSSYDGMIIEDIPAI